jgi:hypothetical protein
MSPLLGNTRAKSLRSAKAPIFTLIALPFFPWFESVNILPAKNNNMLLILSICIEFHEVAVRLVFPLFAPAVVPCTSLLLSCKDRQTT